ncbi:Fur family transcriptional regulator [Sphingomonas morindae]|uniref:Transcriptional repressor n=1 Tax=Sphingomonas morindae TaxID=1541170 RepID=A0ABY4X6I4_9SPHN|nr:transcriptional repressor [Sphingomonas morindae]USI72533.1 transcriptional repressor [Sphingomonas morindae]
MVDPDAERMGTQPPEAVRPSRKRAAVVPGPLLERTLFDILADDDVPLSAYSLAAGLRVRSLSVPMPSIYRALDRMVSAGAIQKVETRSAYRIRDKAEAVLMICVVCGRTTSLAVPVEHRSLVRIMHNSAFAVTGLALEATGHCSKCRGLSDGDPAFEASGVEKDHTP